jgi:TonB family protein
MQRAFVAGFACAAIAAGCSSSRPVPEIEKAGARRVPPAAAAPMVPPLTLDGYKKAFARQVAYASPETFDEPLPEMLKSVVVLDITIDSDGRLARVLVRRSNGYAELEKVALNSVRRAAPYASPAWTMRRSDGSVHFLETFLFRNDGRFRIRSLVE